VLLVWNRLIIPNGRSIVLERQQVDPSGHAGLEDGADNHWKQLIGAALFSTLLSVGREPSAGTDISTNNRYLVLEPYSG
jgi:type IV secretion system protein VirB10